jgi:hypothetical protein
MKTEWDYSQLADAYLKRPPYSGEALDTIFSIAGLEKGSRVCDIGAGVGHLTIPLLKKGYVVTAVEPNDAMRVNGIKQTAEYKDVIWTEAGGEDTSQPPTLLISSVSVRRLTSWIAKKPCGKRPVFSSQKNILPACGITGIWMIRFKKALKTSLFRTSRTTSMATEERIRAMKLSRADFLRTSGILKAFISSGSRFRKPLTPGLLTPHSSDNAGGGDGLL